MIELEPKPKEPPKEVPKVVIDPKNPCNLIDEEYDEINHYFEIEGKVEKQLLGS